ncbi:MAG: SCO family protein [Rickettsia sp.]|nr:SCO family protein [Rickettsia sp.]
MSFSKHYDWLIFISISCSSVFLCLLCFSQFPSDKIRSIEDLNSREELEMEDLNLKNTQLNLILSEIINNNPTILYFGALSCKEICYKVLEKISFIENQLKQNNIQTNIAFITLNPERDNIQLLHSILSKINTNFIAIKKTITEVKKISNLFKVYYFFYQMHPEENYQVAHSSYIYILDKNAELIKFFSSETKSNEIIKFLLTQI